MLRTLFRRALAAFCVFALVWIVVIGWWRAADRLPTPPDVLGYLLALPAGMIVAYALLRRSIDGIRAVAAPLPVPLAAEPAPAVAPSAAAEPADAVRTQRAALVGIAVRTAVGGEPAAVAAALREGARAPLDAELKDANGLPVCAARAGALDASRLDGLRTMWATQFAADAPKASDSSDLPDLPDHATLRAIALLHDALLDAVALAGSSASHPAPYLHAAVLVPPDWSTATCTALAHHLKQQVARFHPLLRLDVATVSAPSAAGAFAQLDLAILALAHDVPDDDTRDAGGCRIVAATWSVLDDAAIAREDAAQRLFTAARPHGETAGEAAAALVLRAPSREPADGPGALVARPFVGARNGASTPAAPRLPQIVAAALAAAQTDAAAIGAVVADRGARAADAIELANLTGAQFPTLEPLALDAGCGATGAAGALLAVALGAQHVFATGRAALAATLADPHERAALVVLPRTGTLPNGTPGIRT